MHTDIAKKLADKFKWDGKKKKIHNPRKQKRNKEAKKMTNRKQIR